MAAAGAIAAGGIIVLIIVRLRRAITGVHITTITVAGQTEVMDTAKVMGMTNMMITTVMATTAINPRR